MACTHNCCMFIRVCNNNHSSLKVMTNTWHGLCRASQQLICRHWKSHPTRQAEQLWPRPQLHASLSCAKRYNLCCPYHQYSWFLSLRIFQGFTVLSFDHRRPTAILLGPLACLSGVAWTGLVRVVLACHMHIHLQANVTCARCTSWGMQTCTDCDIQNKNHQVHHMQSCAVSHIPALCKLCMLY